MGKLIAGGRADILNYSIFSNGCHVSRSQSFVFLLNCQEFLDSCRTVQVSGLVVFSIAGSCQEIFDNCILGQLSLLDHFVDVNEMVFNLDSVR